MLFGPIGFILLLYLKWPLAKKKTQNKTEKNWYAAMWPVWYPVIIHPWGVWGRGLGVALAVNKPEDELFSQIERMSGNTQTTATLTECMTCYCVCTRLKVIA